MVLRARSQLILTFNGPIGLDHAAVFRLGDALRVPQHLLAEMLPDIEDALLGALKRTQSEPEDDDL